RHQTDIGPVAGQTRLWAVTVAKLQGLQELRRSATGSSLETGIAGVYCRHRANGDAGQVVAGGFNDSCASNLRHRACCQTGGRPAMVKNETDGADAPGVAAFGGLGHCIKGSEEEQLQWNLPGLGQQSYVRPRRGKG